MFQKDSRALGILKSVSKIVSHVKKTNMNSQMDTTLKIYSSTRWNGALTMLKSFSRNFQNLYDALYVRHRQNPREKYFAIISNLDTDAICQMCSFLEQFQELTKALEGEKNETLSYVWPTYTHLLTALDPQEYEIDEEESSIIREMRRAGRAYLLSRKSDFEPTVVHKVATFLNPAFKELPIVSAEEKQIIYDAIKSMCGGLDEEPVIEQIPETSQTQQNRLHPFFRSFCADRPAQNHTPPNELERYIEHTIDNTAIDCTEWWNGNRKSYPKLFRLFARISCIPASSASGERVSSRTGLIVSSLRSTILPENVNNLIISRNEI